jgi:transcription initiation factor TFIIH subunit 1
MSPPSGAASYKKKDGTLAISADERSVSWSPIAADAAKTVTIIVANITSTQSIFDDLASMSLLTLELPDLQQTPIGNPKVMLKIFAQTPDAPPNSTPESYTFQFTAGADARSQADIIKDTLSARVNMVKSATPSQTPAPSGGADVSAAMAIANAVTSAGTSINPLDEEKKLRGDVDLQQSLLRSDSNLQKMFFEGLHTKPEALTSGAFVSQFWSTRLHLLRAHAIEQGQVRGSYNVLSSLKPRVEDNVTRLNISKEQIQLIFTQHPLVKRVYDENVPKLSEQQFWSRFFQSRLFKKLRGERISEADATDAVLDKYLRADEGTSPDKEMNIHHFLDLAGNEGNHSQRRGNRPDLDMRPSGVDKVPIIRTLNNLSEKIMANVAPADGDMSAPIGLNEEAWKKLQLQDLRGDEEQSRITLHIRDQSRFFSQGKESDQAKQFAQQDPDQLLQTLRAEIAQSLPSQGNTQLGKLVDPGDDEDEEMEDAPASRRPVGSSAALHDAFAQILEAVRDHRAQMNEGVASETHGLSTALFERLTLTHATTTEFLHQFWQAFLSGNPDRAGEVASLAESLQRATERIKAVANDAEAERKVEVDRLKKHAREVYESTGRKLRVNLEGVEGGQKVVNQLLGPTLHALEVASTRYRKDLAEQNKEAAALAV